MKNLVLLAALVAAPAFAGTTNILVQTNTTTILDNPNNGPQSVDGPASGGLYFASADFGVLKSYASAVAPTTADPCCGYYNASLGVTASFTDVVTIDAPLGVTSGNFTATLFLSGTLTPQASASFSGNAGFAVMQARLELPDAALTPFDLAYTISNYSGFIGGGGGSLNGNRYTGPFTGAFTFSIPFESLVGQTIKVSLKCGVDATNVQAGDTAGGECDFAHSLYWGGISGGTDQNGDPISGLVVNSGSGFNYSNASPLYVPPAAVPEPSSWALLIAGFGLTGAAMRRRNDRQVTA